MPWKTCSYTLCHQVCSLGVKVGACRHRELWSCCQKALVSARAWLMISLQAYNRIWTGERQIQGEAKACLAQLVLPSTRKGERLTDRFGHMRIWALLMSGHMVSVQCLRTASSQEIAATRGSEGGWFAVLRLFSILVIFFSVKCKDHKCHWILKTLEKLLLLSPFTNRRQLIWLLTSNFLCFWSFQIKLWSCGLTRVMTVATAHLRKGQTTMGREKNTSESAP